MTPRIAVLGGGALGQLYAGLLHEAGRLEVTVVSRRAELVAAIRDRGIIVRRLATGEAPLRSRPDAVTADQAPAGVFDGVLLLHKSQDSAWAIGTACRMAMRRAVIVSLQNGLATGAAVEEADPRGVAGATYQGARYLEPGVVEHTVLGALVAAPRPAIAERVGRLLALLDRPDVPVAIAGDRDAMLWEKVFGAVSNALSGALLLPIGDLSRSTRAWELLEDARSEVLAVAGAAGVRVDRGALLAKFASRPVSPCHHLSSTYQSLMSGRPSEVGELVGEVEEAARAHGVGTPVLSTLRRLVLVREQVAGLRG